MIKLYVYSKSTGLLVSELTGLCESVILNISSNEDFTLTAPPDYEHVWRWIDTKWVEVPKSNAEKSLEDWQRVKDERLRKISSGVLVKSTGKVFQTDINSLTQYASIAGMIALDNYEPIEWKTEDNSFVLLTVEVFKELQKEINKNTQAAFSIAEQNRVANQPS